MSINRRKTLHTLAFAMGVSVIGTAICAQAPQDPPRKKGIFALADMMSGKPKATSGDPSTTSPKGSAASTANYTTLSGTTYQTFNFRHVSQEQGQSFQKAMDEKNGFRSYRLGMTPEEFEKAAKEAGETFHRAHDNVLSGPDTVTLEANGQGIMNQIPVEIIFGFYQKRLAKIQIKATDTLLTKAKASQLYRAVAEAFGPGLVLRKPPAPNMPLTQYIGVGWFSEKMEVDFGGTYDPSESLPRRKDPLSATIRDEEGWAYITFQSKEILKPYYELLAKKAKAGI